MKILSLYNGISCGRVAFERAGIKVDRYISYEIDEYANQISKHNYPNDEYYGDVTTEDFSKYKGEVDIVIGGSPCTHWSIAKKNRETTSEGIGYELFSHFVRAIKETGAKYFMYENNHSIHKDIKAEITKDLGVEFIMINSALVSAQQRKRCYWTNIPGVTQPGDKVLLLKDILESGYPISVKNQGKEIKNYSREKSLCLLARDYKGFGNQEMTAAFEPISPYRIGQIGKGGQGDRIYSVKGKSVCLSANGDGRGAKTGLYKIDLPDGDYIIRKLAPLECERLQTLPDGYTLVLDENGKQLISNTQRYKGLGNGWTIDVIAHILRGIK